MFCSPRTRSETKAMTQAEKSAGTRKEIIDAARQIFARDGFAAASLAEIVDRAGVTTGAVYHHFGGKKNLFIAVAEHLEQSILDEVAANMPVSGSPWEMLEAAVLNTLEICARPDIQRIVFHDAPTVVGLAEWREIEIKYSFGLMRKTLALLEEEGVIDAPNTDLTAQILLGAIMEAAHGIALADDKAMTLCHGKATIRKMLVALRAS
ncbi:MAG: TetR/AcrR family transcriptional regulator [Myxococcales bacterium]|nr:TetR/AcrR family transcriptional regulator [Myxococcales bacterium]